MEGRRKEPNMANRPGFSAAARLAALFAGLLGLACQPSIGDRCVISTDCSQRGDRLCDRSQPDNGGYCTIFNCVGNGCPDEAACVVFGGSVPGCTYSDRGISRSARSFCLKTCETTTDCRSQEGYVCKRVVRPGVSKTTAEVEGLVLDDAPNPKVCVLEEGAAPLASMPDAAVCRAEGPAVDLGVFDASSGPQDASRDSAPEGAAPLDSGAQDAGPRDASDGGG